MYVNSYFWILRTLGIIICGSGNDGVDRSITNNVDHRLFTIIGLFGI